MKLLVLTPTYGRSTQMLENLLYCFEAQSHHDKFLIIYDDMGNVEEQRGDQWCVKSVGIRHPSLPDKYHAMISMANEMKECKNYEAVVIMDDDDVYLADYLRGHNAAFEVGQGNWSHPSQVWSTYTGSPELENAAGRFHGSLAIERSFFELGINGWRQNLRADFDQDIITRCGEIGHRADPNGFTDAPQYVFRWADSGGHHCQACMKTPDDTTWYEETASHRTNKTPIGKLEPRLDLSAKQAIGRIAKKIPAHKPRKPVNS